MSILISIVENNALVRRGLVLILEDINEVTVLFEAENGKDLLNKLKGKKPHVILMDIAMPEMNGFEATKIIREQFPEIKVIALSVHTEEDYILKMIKHKANGYLSKDDDPRDVIQAIYSVYHNGFYFNNRVSVALLNKVVNEELIESNFNENYIELTDREEATLKLLCEELSNAEISEKLFVAKRTVEGYRSKLLEKTGARNLAGLVIFAIKNKYFQIE